MRRCLATLLLAVHAAAGAADAPLATAAPPAMLSVRAAPVLPLAAPFTDSQSRTLPLAAVLAGPTPVLLALGYDRCPQLCGLVLQGALEAAHASGLPGDAYRLLFVSIDPRDTPADAAARERRERGYARVVAGDAVSPRVDAWVGPPASVAALAQALGYRYAATPEAGDAQFAHPAALFVLAADGRLVRTLGGVRFDAGALRTAVLAAADGRIDGDTDGGIGDRLALLCAHLAADPGGRSAGVMIALRGVGLATLLALAALAWRTRRGRAR